MVLSYPDQSEIPDSPAICRCRSQKGHFQKRGKYFRLIAQVWAYFFQCTRCKTHITMLPGSCTPYKHHPASDIEQCLDQCTSGRSPHVIDRQDRPGIHRSTLYRWLSEWRINSSQLASIASEKFSCLISGSFKKVYQVLRQKYSSQRLLPAMQPDLCASYPPMGVFRPLICLS